RHGHFLAARGEHDTRAGRRTAGRALGRALLAAEDAAEDGAANRAGADLRRVFTLARFTLEGERVRLQVLAPAVHADLVERERQVGAPLHTARALDVGHGAAQYRARGNRGVAADGDGVAQPRADGRLDLRRFGRDGRRHLERQRGARRNRHLAELGQSRRGRLGAGVLARRQADGRGVRRRVVVRGVRLRSRLGPRGRGRARYVAPA